MVSTDTSALGISTRDDALGADATEVVTTDQATGRELAGIR
jgi:hypothetical protein